MTNEHMRKVYEVPIIEEYGISESDREKHIQTYNLHVMESSEMGQTKVIENSVHERIHLRAGDKIRLVRIDGYPDYGVGIVVGFSDASGCPHAYFYSEQEILAVPFDAVIRA